MDEKCFCLPQTANCNDKSYVTIPSEHVEFDAAGVVSTTTDARCGTVFSSNTGDTTPGVVTCKKPLELDLT